MIDNIVSHIIRFKKVWGIHVDETNGIVRLSAILLEYKKGVLNILQEHRMNSLEKLDEIEIGEIPVSLSYSSDNILSKRIELNSKVPIDEIIHVPDIEQFHVQLFQSGNFKFLSVIRKENFEKFISSFYDRQISIVLISLEAYCFSHMLEYIDYNQKKEFLINNYRIKLDNEGISEILPIDIKDTATLKIGTTEIKSDLILPYSNVIASISLNEANLNLIKSDWKQLAINYKHKIFVKKGLPLSLGSILFILLLNFIILQVKTDEFNKRSQILLHHQSQLTKLDKLEQDFEDKQKFLGELNLNDYKYYSYYADRIAATIIKDIKLSSLVINPIANDQRKNVIHFRENIINISGICNSSSELNHWLIALEKQPFIQEITNQVFELNDYDEKGHFSFTLKVIQP
ncbi:hypothetical protein SLH46_21030 [Draconibacterium sp. IB214405]|uniref:hypothetical protein n=1 Tax=Draconibacterium sp. IB214405 TaxID=3097352 RepID=UPI002A172AE4|nr:hypothetical protein [Draconibacterium sp. IB214405]MDX8341696.1 hypothetical protein [Draconibacterium sp. IB214405]